MRYFSKDCHIYKRFNTIQRFNKHKKVYFNRKILINYNINSSGDKEIGDIYNILITGVGGQGVVLLGKILREYGMQSPLIKNVVGTETRGVSQREINILKD